MTAASERVGRIAIRCQTEFADAYLRLVARGYRVHWTDLRMTLEGYPAAGPVRGDASCRTGRSRLPRVTAQLPPDSCQ